MTTTRQEEIGQIQKDMSAAYAEHGQGLNKHSYFKVHNRELSEDLVQDTFMKTCRYLIRGGKIDVMRAFLYHALNGLIIDEYRKHKTTSLDTLLESGFDRSNGEEGRLMDVLDGKGALLLIQRLPVKYRKVMRMRYTQSLSLSEMAALTGQTKNAVAVQVHRGLEKLKELYNSGEPRS